jgi:DtxR family manganese transport transcriptional regulator
MGSAAQRFKKTREARAQEIAQDYVEAIAELIAENGSARVVDLARKFGVSHVTVNRTITRLSKQELVTSEAYRAIELTKRGRALASTVQRRHAVVLRFLLDIGVPEETAIIDAEGIEHHVSSKTLEAFSRFSSSCLSSALHPSKE